MMITGINPANAKVGFGAAQKTEKKAEELPTFIYDTDKLPEGYHWEQDLDHDKFVAVKNGYTFDETKFIATPNTPYMPNINFAKPQVKQTDLMYQPAIDEQPKAGYHWDHYLDGDKFYAVKDGYHLDEDGKAIKD